MPKQKATIQIITALCEKGVEVGSASLCLPIKLKTLDCSSKTTSGSLGNFNLQYDWLHTNLNHLVWVSSYKLGLGL